MGIKIGLVDDHQLFLQSLGMMLASFKGVEVIMEAANGKDLQEKMAGQYPLPNMMLVDVNMPVMDGTQTAVWLTENYPAIKLVALSMKDDDKTVIDMLRAGCCAYLLKDTHPDELEKALNEVYSHGYYNGDVCNINFRRLPVTENAQPLNFSDKEKTFLEHACTEMTYKQIAATMNVSEHTIDGYREALFEKLHVCSRVGLVMEAIRKGIVKL